MKGKSKSKRFLRSRRQRILLLTLQNDACAICGQPITLETMHVDHEVPYCLSGRTILPELQGLCAACNLKKGDRYMDLSKARRGQSEAFEVIMSRLRAGERETAIVLPTGYGKSDLIRLVAFEAWDMGFAACALVISPSENLREQLVRNSKMREFEHRYDVRPRSRKKPSYAEIPKPLKDFAANGEYLLSVCIQLVETNLDLFCEWLMFKRQRTGKPIVIVVDETHTNSSKNRWGEVLAQLRDAGAILVVMTATAFREDGEPLVGFEIKEVDNEPVIITKTRPSAEPDMIHVEIWEGTKFHYELVPHYAVSYKDAWDEGALCHINMHSVPVSLSILDGDTVDERQLSDLSESETRKILGRLVRHPLVIEACCREMINWLRRVRAAGGFVSQDCAAIVFSASDEKSDARANEHANQIRQAILKIDPSLDVRIATSVSDYEVKSSGSKVLEDFSDRGRGDVLIVKSMGGQGFDAPRIKVACDLSPVRSVPGWIQRQGRYTRPYNGIMIGHLVTPADVLSLACMQKYIISEGGATTETIFLKEEYDVEKDESPPPPVITVQGAGVADTHDTKNKFANRQMIRRVLWFIEAFPQLLNTLTVPEIAERLDSIGVPGMPEPPEEESSAVNTGDRVKQIKTCILEDVKSIVKLRMAKAGRHYSKDPEDKAFYQETIRSVWTDAYRLAKLPVDSDYQKISDLPMLEAILAAVEILIQQEIS